MHPFREGNGRAQRAFLDQVAAVSARKLTWRNVADLENNAASAEAVRTSELAPLRALLAKVIRPPADGLARFDVDAYRATPTESVPPKPAAALCRGGCGKTLTAPQSIARGFEDICWKKRNG